MEGAPAADAAPSRVVGKKDRNPAVVVPRCAPDLKAASFR
jgi:hypothetical protein